MNPPTPSHTFLQEAEDLLVQIEVITLELRPGEVPGEPINHLFRAFHTIKGSGAMFGFDQVAAFTHHVETVLDRVRAGALTISEELLNLVLAAKDQIKALLDSTRTGDVVPAENGGETCSGAQGVAGKQSRQRAANGLLSDFSGTIPATGVSNPVPPSARADDFRYKPSPTAQ